MSVDLGASLGLDVVPAPLLPSQFLADRATTPEVDTVAPAREVLVATCVDTDASTLHASGDADAAPREVEAEERT